MRSCQVSHSGRQPSLRASAVTETRFGIPDDLTGDELVRRVLREFPHPHPCPDGRPVLLRQPLACFSFPIPGGPAALAAFFHQFCYLLVPGLCDGGKKEFPFLGKGREADIGTSGVYGQHHRLQDRVVLITQLYGKRDMPGNACPAGIQ